MFFNQDLAALAQRPGFSRWYVFVPVSLAVILGMMRVNYERFRAVTADAKHWQSLVQQRESARAKALEESVSVITALLQVVGTEGHPERLATCHHMLTNTLRPHLTAPEFQRLSATLQYIRLNATGTHGPLPGEEMSLKAARDFLLSLMENETGSRVHAVST